MDQINSSMKRKFLPKWLNWKNLNKPLIVVMMSILIVAGLYLLFGHEEKVRCDFMVHPDREYLAKELNFSDDAVTFFMNYYSKPFRLNLTFENYQEALAFKQLAIDGQNHNRWYTPALDCDEAKIELPPKFKDAMLRNMENGLK